MVNKKTLLALAVSVYYTTCVGNTALHHDFLKKTHEALNGAIERIELNFKVDGKEGPCEYWLMTRKQFKAFRELLEYATVGCRIVVDEQDVEKRFIEFSDQLDFERNNHFCCVKKASLVDKLFICWKKKTMRPLLSNAKIHVAEGDNFTHVAIRCNLKINTFGILNLESRLYPNVPAESTIGNLPGIYLRGNGKTTKTGDLVGFSYRAEKDGPVNDYPFGQIWEEPAE